MNLTGMGPEKQNQKIVKHISVTDKISRLSFKKQKDGNHLRISYFIPSLQAIFKIRTENAEIKTSVGHENQNA